MFGFVDFDEQIGRIVRIVFGLGLSDIVFRGLGLWLCQLWQQLSTLYSVVLPPPLMAGLGVELINGRRDCQITCVS